MFLVAITDGFEVSCSVMLKGFIAGNLLKQERRYSIFNNTFIIQGFYKHPKQAHLPLKRCAFFGSEGTNNNFTQQIEHINGKLLKNYYRAASCD